MYLVDTNVWLQVLRGREHADAAGRFLSETPVDRLFVTDFTVFSIGIVLERYDQLSRYPAFLQQSSIGAGVKILRLSIEDLLLVSESTGDLDFDDAYQYVAAMTHGLTIVSYDTDFDKTEHGRLEPAS